MNKKEGRKRKRYDYHREEGERERIEGEDIKGERREKLLRAIPQGSIMPPSFIMDVTSLLFDMFFCSRSISFLVILSCLFFVICNKKKRITSCRREHESLIRLLHIIPYTH